MMKKLFIFWGLTLYFVFMAAAFAQEGGKIVLDLTTEEEFKDEGIPGLIEMGLNYIHDVQDYNQLLDGQNINKDLTADIRAKYPRYDENMAKDWQKYVKKGIKAYRFYEDVKRKITLWVMSQEKPLVVAENQYEMGEEEQYIESDKPIVIHDFKKVVAYSDSEKDQLAAREKYAKDHGLPRPSQLMEKYKKALLEKDWATLFDFDWREYFADFYATPEGKADFSATGAKAVILSQFDGIDDKGRIAGVILVKPQDDNVILLSDYEEYKGLSVDFGGSENIKDVKVHFVLPQLLEVEQKREIQVYSAQFPIYFSAQAADSKKPVVLQAEVQADMCREFECRIMKVAPKLKLDSKEKVKETSFATYVRTVLQNTPRESNRNKFNFGRLAIEKDKDGKPKGLRLDVETVNAPYFKIFMIGDAAKHFAKPRIGIDNDKVVARFDLLNEQFVPADKNFTFWVMTNGTNQYLQTMTAQEMSSLDIQGDRFSLGILVLAFVGGLLLNLMPCVFPVLSLKLLAFTKFGGLNAAQIRSNFMYNSLGIAVAFSFIAFLLTGLKAAGYALGWGMQFQNVYFLAAIIWIVTLFLAHILGIINLRSPQFAGKILDHNKNRGRWFEFLSGMFLVLLSTPCMAPYLGTAFGVALAGNVTDIILTVMAVGMGLAVPYLLIAACPGIALYMPKPGKWLDTINILMVVMLIVTIGWLVSVLAAQSSASEIWHWLIYLLLALVLLFFRKTVKSEINKLSDRRVIAILHRRTDIFFGILLLALIIGSMADAGMAAAKRRHVVEETKLTTIDERAIAENVRYGQKVLVKVGADWCLTCQYNEAFVFNVEHINDLLMRYNVKMLEVDWTRYEPQVLQFMQKYGRRGLPFYVLFSPTFPEGIVLPEMLDTNDLTTLIEM